jgi:hypothetical protein
LLSSALQDRRKRVLWKKAIHGPRCFNLSMLLTAASSSNSTFVCLMLRRMLSTGMSCGQCAPEFQCHRADAVPGRRMTFTEVSPSLITSLSLSTDLLSAEGRFR